ncbi:MAG: hypothetical protein ABL949_17240, partial [Fimbriimonadaceae bacterium]
PGLLPKPFLTRFHLYSLAPYTAAEVAEILRLTGVPGDETFRSELAAIARLNPRQAKLRAEEVLQYHRVHGVPMTLDGLGRVREWSNPVECKRICVSAPRCENLGSSQKTLAA